MPKVGDPKVGDIVRLVEPASGMAAESEGKLLGWFRGIPDEALVSFWDGGPLKVPADAIATVEQEARPA